jgi:crotonobetaine/carnitine-CoA ligase
MRRFSVSRFWQVVARFDVTDLLLIGSMPVLLLKAPPNELEQRHRVRYAVCVGVSKALHRELTERFGFPWLDNYGSTEAGLVARVPLDHAEQMIGSGSIGIPVPEVDVRILDAEGRELPVGNKGELVVRSLVMFDGYLNEPEVTAKTLRDGWHHSGDLACQDEQGFLYFLGREKDAIRRSGETVAAAEIEEVLRMHPKVLDVAVVPEPDDLRGEEIKAFVHLVAGATIEAAPPEELASHCAERLAPFKVPRYIAYHETDFPRTPSQRIRKKDLRHTKAVRHCWDRECGEFVESASYGQGSA